MSILDARRRSDLSGRGERVLAFLAGGGELGQLIAAHDWAATSIGPIDAWPGYLRACVAMLLRAPAPMAAMYNADGVLIYNAAYAELLGRRHPGALGCAIREAFPEQADFHGQVLERVLAGGSLSCREREVALQRRGQAETVWLNFDYSPLMNDEGAPCGVLAIVADATEKIRAERQAQKSEASFHAVAQALPNHVWTATPDGLFDWFNDRTAQYTGLPKGTGNGNAWVQALHPDDVGEAVRLWREAVASGTHYEVESRIRRFDGAYRWFIGRALPVRDAAGNIERWIGTTTDIHERRMAEDESTRARNRMWALSQEYMLIFDQYGFITAINPAITKVSEWTEEDMLGKSLMEFLHPDDLPGTAVQLGRLASGMSVNSFETRCRMKDGSYRVIDWAAVPEGGRVHTVGRDITNERAAQRERERSWLLSPLVKLVAREDGEVLAVNPAWSRVLGWGEEESVGRHVLDFVASEDRDAGVAGMNLLAERQGPVEYLNIFATRTGERRCIEWTMVPDGGLIYGFGRDITAEREASEALAASTAERDRIWRSTNDLMGTAGLDGYLKAVNPAWGRLLGYTDDELLSRGYMEFFDPADHEKTRNAIAQLAEGKGLRDFENRVVHADNTRSLISWVAEPMGDIFYCVGRNITEQRMAEEALRQSQKMEAVGQLTGGIAHDFNNLLQGITGSLDLLQKRIAQGRVGELGGFIAGAMGAASRASALTHRLLAFSRRQPLNPRPVLANPLVVSMEDLLRRTMGERIELELVLSGGLWLTLCDPNQLENAVLNLAINGRDAMPDGGKLTIQTINAQLDEAFTARSREIRPGQYVCICVTDTGTGMSEDTIAKAFEPFFTTKPIGQGTGLGLSMIYGFARQSEGYAKIESELGRGTSVKLFLPRFRGSLIAEDVEAERQPVARAVKGETVLLVEDDSIVRGLIMEVLKDLGYAALEAADGPSGLEILRTKKRIDLLITDIGLPGLNGRQVAEAGRLLRPGLKVLFMTGYAENAALASGFLEPGMAMMTKPFAMEAMASRIRGIIEEG